MLYSFGSFVCQDLGHELNVELLKPRTKVALKAGLSSRHRSYDLGHPFGK
jgi:hypothetical protein